MRVINSSPQQPIRQGLMGVWPISPQADSRSPDEHRGAVPVETVKMVDPATKPADPAFVNALRPRRLRIGLRYLGD